MLKERTRIVSTSFLVADQIATTAAFAAAHGLRVLLGRVADEWLGPVYPFERYAPLLLVILPLWGLVFAAVGLYGRRGSLGLRTDAARLLKAVAICGSILVFLIFTFKLQYVSRPVILLFLFVDALAVEGGRRFVRGFVLGAHADRRVLVAGGHDEVLRAAAHADAHRDWGLRVVGLITDGSWEDAGPSRHQVLGTIDQVPDLVQQHVVDEVIMAPTGGRLDRMEGFDRVFPRLHELGIAVCLLVNFLPNAAVDVSFAEFGGMPMLTFSNAPRNEAVLFIRRCADAALAGMLLLVLSPVLLLIALAIKATSHGPVLFRQTRCGLNGRPFTFLKFRSMHIGADALKPSLASYNEMDGPAFKMTNDPRVTRAGRFLRKTSLDELPQLWNILRGDMSFVGPRPAVVEEVRQYEPWQRRRLSMKPGLTCLWQVSGRNQLSFDDWMRLDLEYIDNWSLWLDVKIALKTIPAVLRERAPANGRGASAPPPASAMAQPTEKKAERLIAENRKAYHDYHLLETFEAGVALLGTEVKAIREGRVNLRDSFARVEDGEVFLHNVHISPYSHRGYAEHDPLRRRKLLLHRAEIRKLIGKTVEKGMTLVPVRMYFKNGRVKVAVGLAKGKKEYDKRETIKRRETERETRAAMKSKGRGE